MELQEKQTQAMLEHSGNLFRKNPQLKDTYSRLKRPIPILDLKPFRSQVKRRHFVVREIHSLPVRRNKFLTYTFL